MKRINGIKFLLVILLILFSTVLITGCESNTNTKNDKQDQQEKNAEEKKEEPVLPVINQEKIDFCIDMINEIGNVTLKSKEDIEYASELYAELTIEEKILVTNYNDLARAIDKLNYLEHEDEAIIVGYQDCKDFLDETIPEVVPLETLELGFITRYDYENEYNNYIFTLDWSTDNVNSIGRLGGVYHSKEETVVTITCVISCLKLKDTATFTKQVTVEAIPHSDVETPVVISYFYGKYTGLSDIDYATFDIVNYSFVQIAKKIENNKTVYYLSTTGLQNIEEAVDDLHKHAIKVVLSIGGWHDDSSFWNTYSEAASTDANRKMVAASILEVMERYNLDGIDMDWEYPTTSDKANFTLLMKEISQTLKAKDSKYIISGAFPAGEWAASKYEYDKLNLYMDYFNVMTYDLDLDGTSVTKHLTDVYTTKACAQVLINHGVTPSKVVVGSAFYGRVFKDVASTNHGLNQKASSRTYITYDRIVTDYYSRLNTEVFEYYDNSAQSYYMYDTVNKEFLTYDNELTVQAKYQYAYDNGLGGFMYWSYTDNKNGQLVTAINTLRTSIENAGNTN